VFIYLVIEQRIKRCITTGSPPTRAIPNAIGNTNGNIPTAPPQIPHRGPNLFQRIFPGLRRNAPTRPVGGGIDNDGVFANLNAKPSRGRVVSDGDNGVHVVPEEVQAEAPPSVCLHHVFQN